MPKFLKVHCDIWNVKNYLLFNPINQFVHFFHGYIFLESTFIIYFYHFFINKKHGSLIRVLKFNIVMPFLSRYFLSSQTNRKRKVCTHESSKKKCWLWHKVGIENLSSFHTIMLHSYPSQGTLPQGIEFLSK